MLAALGVVSIVWCLCAPLPACFRRYFWALLVQGVLIWPCYWLWGNLNSRYVVAYCLLTAPILIFVIEIAWRSLDSYERRLRKLAIPFILTITLCRMAYLDLPKPVSAANWVVLTQAFVLAGAGTILGSVAPYCQNKSSAFILGLLWVVRAVFDLGYALHFPAWERLNVWLPSALCSIAFLLVGTAQRFKR